jgi:hypothetical protein
MKLVMLIEMCLNETYNKARVGKDLSDSLPIQSGMKEKDALLPLLFNFALNCHSEGPENHAGLKLSGTHKLLAYADDVNVLGGNVDTITKNTEMLIDASKEVGLEINIEKTN